jgi:V/A-type H+-transporting ATPase subunit I
MTKISVTGPRTELRSVIDTLYEMKILDIDDYQGEELESGNPFEEAEDISETLVDVRSLISKLPDVEHEKEDFNLENVQSSISELKEKIDRIEEEKNNVASRLNDLEDKKKFFRKLEGTGLSYSDLEGSERLEAIVGEVKGDLSELESGRFEVFEGRDLSVVIYDREDEETEEKIHENVEEHTVPDIDEEGGVKEIIESLESRRSDAERSLETLEGQLNDMSKEWYGRLESVEEYLTERVEKAEAPINFASTEKTFIAQGWIPEGEYERIEEELCDATEGKIHIQKEEAEDEPPVKHDNPGPVSSFESLTDLMSVPKYNELDPSFVLLLTFPAMFGFMIGDAGYGLSSFIVFLAGYKMFPKAKEIFKSLMWASGFTFLFGLYFSEAFGHVYNFFGHKSQLAAMTGIEFFRKIPVFHKGGHSAYTVFGLFPEPGINSWTVIFGTAALIGVAHVNLGYLLGFYNEITNHGFVEAFLEKGSWIMLEISAIAFLIYGPMIGGGLALLSVVLLYMGEGIEGVVEIPSLLSNILSYLRLFGVAVAAFSLAKVVNALAEPLFQMGGVTGIVLGITMLVFGHTFNTFIKIIEGFLQGIRLHYVEMFSKFYEGGGRKYIPFGARDLS